MRVILFLKESRSRSDVSLGIALESEFIETHLDWTTLWITYWIISDTLDKVEVK